MRFWLRSGEVRGSGEHGEEGQSALLSGASRAPSTEEIPRGYRVDGDRRTADRKGSYFEALGVRRCVATVPTHGRCVGSVRSLDLQRHGSIYGASTVPCVSVCIAVHSGRRRLG